MERLDSVCMARKIKRNSVPKTVKFCAEKQKKKKKLATYSGKATEIMQLFFVISFIAVQKEFSCVRIN